MRCTWTYRTIAVPGIRFLLLCWYYSTSGWYCTCTHTYTRCWIIISMQYFGHISMLGVWFISFIHLGQCTDTCTMEYTCTACTAYTCCAVSTLYYTNKSLIKGFKASPVPGGVRQRRYQDCLASITGVGYSAGGGANARVTIASGLSQNRLPWLPYPRRPLDGHESTLKYFAIPLSIFRFCCACTAIMLCIGYTNAHCNLLVQI